MNNTSKKILYKTSTISDGNMSFCVGDTEHSSQNREEFVTNLNIPVNRYICMRCNHGEQITAINRSNPHQRACGAKTQEDMLLSEVLVTQEKSLALMLLTADCLPVSFYDPVTRTIALAHFSRETISKSLPQKTVSFLRKHFAIDPKNLLIDIGPHIHHSSYSFPLPQPELPRAISAFTTKTDSRVHIDLVSACNHQLTEEGVLIENISVSNIDTATSPQHFSHFQSKKEDISDGRLATILMLR